MIKMPGDSSDLLHCFKDGTEKITHGNWTVEGRPGISFIGSSITSAAQFRQTDSGGLHRYPCGFT